MSYILVVIFLGCMFKMGLWPRPPRGSRLAGRLWLEPELSCGRSVARSGGCGEFGGREAGRDSGTAAQWHSGRVGAGPL